jgi:hypothetical protein
VRGRRREERAVRGERGLGRERRDAELLPPALHPGIDPAGHAGAGPGAPGDRAHARRCLGGGVRDGVGALPDSADEGGQRREDHDVIEVVARGGDQGARRELGR